MAPYCAMPRDYLSDAPLLRAMGFLVSQHGQSGAIPLLPFLRISPWRACEVEVRYPPPPTQKRSLSDTCVRPYENKAKCVRCPPLRYYLERLWRDMGSDGVRVRSRVRFQAVKVPIFGGLPVESPTKKANRLKALLRGISLSEYGSDGFRVRLRRLSEYGSVSYLVERPKRETRAEQYSDTVLWEGISHWAAKHSQRPTQTGLCKFGCGFGARCYRLRCPVLHRAIPSQGGQHSPQIQGKVKF